MPGPSHHRLDGARVGLSSIRSAEDRHGMTVAVPVDRPGRGRFRIESRRFAQPGDLVGGNDENASPHGCFVVSNDDGGPRGAESQSVVGQMGDPIETGSGGCPFEQCGIQHRAVYETESCAQRRRLYLA